MWLGFKKNKRNLPIDRYYFLRKVDELGKLVIPKEIRNELKIEEKDLIELLIGEKSFKDEVDSIGRIVIPKEIREELEIKVADKLKVYIENGNINTYIMYLADDSQDKVRGITTNLDFSEMIQVPNSKDGMNCKCETKLKSIEAKVINGRKVGIKATVEVDIKIYSNEEVEIVNNIQNAEGIQMLKQDLKVNSLVGMGETKIYAKDTITVDNIDNIAEILKVSSCICDKDVKISYNKILTKAEFKIKIMYLTEDNRIKTKEAKIPVVGFIDIPNVTEENICDVNYEVKNVVIKLNSIEEHSIYVEAEIGVSSVVYEEKQINLIQDLYSPCENLDCNKKKVSTITSKMNRQETKQIREKIQLEGIDGRNIIDEEGQSNN